MRIRFRRFFQNTFLHRRVTLKFKFIVFDGVAQFYLITTIDCSYLVVNVFRFEYFCDIRKHNFKTCLLNVSKVTSNDYMSMTLLS